MDKVFCEYNPDTDSWRRLTSFPGQGADRHGMVNFVINNKAYVGLGVSSIYHDDFWEYDPATDNWSQSYSMPGGGRFNSIAFVANNKAYIGFGYNGSGQKSDFYVLDPGSTSK